MNRKKHWETVYSTKQPSEVSWYQKKADLSVRLIQEVIPDHSAPIIDVGGGASVLAGSLDAAGYTDMTVLEIAGSAITAARDAVGARAQKIQWIEGDILDVGLPAQAYQCWHDRAVFHFLTTRANRSSYIAQVRHAVRPGGFVIVATFATDGPKTCSGLDVMRYSGESLHAEFGPGFTYLGTHREEHLTPSGSMQAYTYCLCRWEGFGSSVH